jgi:hypothetical protein
MRHVPGDLNECTGTTDNCLAVSHKGHFAFEDIERFLLSRVLMRWWPAAGRDESLSQAVGAAGFLASGKHYVLVANGTVRLP